MKKKCYLIIATVLLYSYALCAQVSFGKAEKINDSWRFNLRDIENSQVVSTKDSHWQLVDLPHDWSIQQQLSPYLASCTGYLPGGIGWYRKTINIPQEKQGEKIYLYFEGIYNRSEVYINGQLLGKRPNGYISFMYDATPYIEFGKENLIAVRVDHTQNADSRWYTGSGIYRNVWIIYADPVHIAQWGIHAFPKTATTQQGVLNVEIEVENGTKSNVLLTVNNELITPEGKIVAKKSGRITIKSEQKEKIIFDMKISNPKLWDLDNPNLYQLKTTLVQNGKIIDQSITNTGFRTFTFDPDKGFALNGNWLKVKGVCIHHDAGVLGAAVPREVWKRKLTTLKKIGCNAVRTSHNPQSPEFYDLCDELGLLVLNEMYDEWEYPKRKWLEGWNVGTPGFEGSYDYFEEWGKRDLADFVRRDRNHISVFAWSIGNEVDYPNDPYSHPVLGGEKAGFTQASYGGYNPDAPDANRLGKIAKELTSVVKQYDNSRPVTAGLAGVAMSNETEYPDALDIAGYNYTESKYESDHKKYPKRVIFGSENRHDMAAWKTVRDKEYIFGQFLWTGTDYLGESGPWPSRGFYTGLLDFGGFVKPRGYFRQALWSETPMIYIGTYPIRINDKRISQDAWPIWNYKDGENIRIVCYTNAPKARLELNGKVVGNTKDYNDETGIIYWDIPYQNGKLEAVGLNENGQEISRYTLQSSKRPYALTAKADKNILSKEKELLQIVIQVVDEDGIPVMLSDNEIACHISGPAKFLGFEGSNNSDMSDYTDDRHRAYHGRLLAYIQTSGEVGIIKINFTAPWLKPIEVVVAVQ